MEISSVSSSPSSPPLHRTHLSTFNGPRRLHHDHHPLTTPLLTKTPKTPKTIQTHTPKLSTHNNNVEEGRDAHGLTQLRGRDVYSLIPKKRSSRTHESTTSPTQPLHLQNPISLLKTLTTHSKHNDLVSAMAILDYLDTRGIPVATTAYSALISAVIRAKSDSIAKRVADHMRRARMDVNNEFLRTKLVTMFAACGMREEAKRVFEECRDRGGGVYSWNALLRGSVVSGGRRYEDVVAESYRMRETGIELNEYSFSCLMKGLAGGGKGRVVFREGLKVHGLLIKNGWIGSQLLSTCLIDLYSKCGKTAIACRVFEEVEDRDVVIWGAVIAGLAHNGMRRGVVEYVRVMLREEFEMNWVLVATVLPVIGELGAWHLGKEVHGYVVKTKGYSQRAFVQSALVDMYCKCGDMESGRKVFHGSKERTLVSWTALISGYIMNGMQQHALKSIIGMQQDGFKPDIVTLVTFVPSCTKLRNLKRGREIHGYALKNNMINVPLTSSLMVLYSKCESLVYSRRLFEGIDQRNVKTWTAMMDSLSENGCLHEALDLFRSMLLSEHQPDSVAMSRVLEVCAELLALNLGKEIHGQVLKKNLELSPFVSVGIMKMYCICGFLNKASLFFDLIPTPDIITQTTMMEIYGYHGQFDRAIAFFDQIVLAGSTPTHVTWKVVLSVCDQAGLVDEACRIFELMTNRFAVTPSEADYSTMFQLFTRAGRLEEAENYRLRSSC